MDKSMSYTFDLKENQIAEFRVPCPHCGHEVCVLIYDGHQYSTDLKEILECECSGQFAIQWECGRQAISGISRIAFSPVKISVHKIHEIHEITEDEVRAVQRQARIELQSVYDSGETSFENPYDHELEEEKHSIYLNEIIEFIKKREKAVSEREKKAPKRTIFSEF